MLDDPLYRHTFIAVVVILGSAIAGRLLKSLIEIVFRKLDQGGDARLNNRILEVVQSRVNVLVLVAGVSFGIREVRKGLTAENVIPHQILDYCSLVLFIVFVIILAKLLSRLIKATVEWYTEKISARNHSDISPAILPFTNKLTNILIIFIVGMILLDHLGVNIGGLFVSLGVGSLAIALAAQETIANMIAWFVILVDQPIRIGDKIRLPSGDEGEVYQIGLRSTRILNPDNNLIIVPNGELVKNRILNLSVPDSGTRILLEVNVAYGTSVEKARTLLLNLAGANAHIQKDPPPQVFLTNLGDAAIQLRLVARTPDFTKKFGIETELREGICKAFEESGIKIPILHHGIGVTNINESQTPPKK